jgi:predicted phage gp36 major capsid-like protein
MSVMPPRESWTDDRLDDFRDEVNRRFDEVDRHFESLEAEMRTEFGAVRREMKEGFERVDEKFEKLYRLMLQLGGVVVAALIGLIATQL